MTMTDLVTGVPVLFLMMCGLATIPFAARAVGRELRGREQRLEQRHALHLRGPVRR